MRRHWQALLCSDPLSRITAEELKGPALLPNLLVIGAAKAGTTSLHEYLALHPELSMSKQKELRFFVREDWHQRVAWYEAQFSDSAPVRGESTPSYSMFPFRPNVAERAQQLIPDARLIYVVRDPLARAIAQYVEFVSLMVEDRPIAAALEDVDDPANPYLCASRYATQLEHYLECFDRSQILVIDYEDLLKSRDLVLRETFKFLGVDPAFVSPEFARLHNTRSTKVRYNALGFWLVKRQIFTQRRGSFRRRPLVGPLRQLLSRPIDKALPASSREILTEALRPEVKRLRELTQKSFSSWTSFPHEVSPEDPRLQVAPP